MKRSVIRIISIILLLVFLVSSYTGVLAVDEENTEGNYAKELMPPENVSGELDGKTVKLTWEPSPDADGYEIYREAKGGDLLLKGQTDQCSCEDTPEAGKAYRYRVVAFKELDDTVLYSEPSAFTSYFKIILDTPKNVNALSTSKTKIKITWSAVEGASQYKIVRVDDATGKNKCAYTTTKTSYTDTACKTGVVYSYKVKACGSSSAYDSAYSTSDKGRAVPPAPKNFKAKKSSMTSVKLSWDATSKADSYKIYCAESASAPLKVIATTSGTSYVHKNLAVGKSYYYQVRAYVKNVSGSLGRATETKKVSLRYHRPTGVKVTQVSSGTSLKVTWNASENAGAYAVYMAPKGGEYKRIAVVTGTSYTATGLTRGTTYSFVIRSQKSTTSKSYLSAKTKPVTAKATYPAPKVTLSPVAGKGIKISWKEISGAKSYRVYRKLPGGSNKLLKVCTGLSFIDTTGKSGTTYVYSVRAMSKKDGTGVYGITSKEQKVVFSKVDPNRPMIALTFDDGPSCYTDDILDAAERYGARVTFFVVGNRVNSYPEAVKRAASLGCEIGNHSWSHPSLDSLSASSLQSELSKTDDAVKKLIGKTPSILRPPYGAYNSTVKSKAGKPLIIWSVDTEDWRTQNSSSTINWVLNHAGDGDIVLMHDLYSASRDAAVSLIPTLINRGYQLVTVSELAAYRGGLNNGSAYFSFR